LDGELSKHKIFWIMQLWIMQLRQAQFLRGCSRVWVVLGTTSWAGQEAKYCYEFLIHFFLMLITFSLYYNIYG